jgi:hypothetical protein
MDVNKLQSIINLVNNGCKMELLCAQYVGNDGAEIRFINKEYIIIQNKVVIKKTKDIKIAVDLYNLLKNK